MPTSRLTVVLFCLFGAGCATTELHHDQDHMRHIVLDLYTNQLLDNLVRAANGLPIIHIDYTNLGGTVTDKATAGVGGNQELTNQEGVNRLIGNGIAAALTHTVKTVFSFTAGAENTNQVTMTGNPVNTVVEVYDAYFDYLTLPNAIMVTDCEPPPCSVHLTKKFCGKWYSIPLERRFDFFKLAVATTCTRGKRLTPVEDFFDIRIEKIEAIPKPQVAKNAHQLRLTLNKKVPNDDGRLVITYKERSHEFYVTKIPSPTIPVVETQVILVDFNPDVKRFAEDPDFNTVEKVVSIAPIDAKLYLETKRPQAPTINQKIDQLNATLEQIRLGQLR